MEELNTNYKKGFLVRSKGDIEIYFNTQEQIYTVYRNDVIMRTDIYNITTAEQYL